MTIAAGPCTSEIEGDVHALIRAALGNRAKIAEYEIVSQQRDYRVLRVRIRHPDRHLVIKLAGPNSPVDARWERSARIMRLVAARTSIPMSEVIAADDSVERWPWRYIIATHIDGREWAAIRATVSESERQSAHRQIGTALAQLHTIQFPAFGKVPTCPTSSPVTSLVAALEWRARAVIRNPLLRDRFLALLEREAGRFEGSETPVLVHDDLHQHNLLFTPSQAGWFLATVLDFDKAWAGAAESDLARLEFWTGMTSDEFWQAYLESHVLDRGYPARRPLYQLLWCFEYAQPTARHLADTNELCSRLGLATIDRF